MQFQQANLVQFKGSHHDWGRDQTSFNVKVGQISRAAGAVDRVMCREVLYPTQITAARYQLELR
jgi:hypothetical protein